MQLNLKLPSHPSLPKSAVETRPKQVQEWLDALPLANTLEAGRKLADAVIALNSVKLDEEARCQLLECYRATVANLAPALQQTYAGRSLPLVEKSLHAAALVRELQGALADGYKIALADLSGRRGNPAEQGVTALALLRVMQCLGEMLEAYYETYVATPSELWAEVHRLYWDVVKLNLQESPVTQAEGRSVNQAYLQILLIALADPYRLPHSHLLIVKAYLARFVQLARLQALGDTENKHGLFLVRLDCDKPPTALIHYQGVTDARTDILLNTIPLARQVHQHLGELESGNLPPQWGLPPTANRAGVRELLKRLIKQWGIAPKRGFDRSPVAAEAHVCGGISAVHRAVSESGSAGLAATEEEVTLELSHHAQLTGSQQSFNCARWALVNESAGGVALASDPGRYAKVKVGDVIGMASATAGQWGIGVVRWVRTEDDQRIAVGAQMLTPSATAIALKPVIAAENALFQPALRLPAMPVLKQPSMILALRGSYQAQREFEVRDQGVVLRVRADKLVEQTDSIDLFTFNPS